MTRRHPFRGLFAGLLLGLGAAVLCVTLGIVPIGTLTPWVVIVAGVLIGLLAGLVAPARGG
jgi:hypothetical protein